MLPDLEDERVGSALVRRLRRPSFSAQIDLISRSTRGGGIFVDGEPLDVDVPAIAIDLVGEALVHGRESLAFLALVDGPWSVAELRVGGQRLSRLPTAGDGWQVVEDAGVRQRLPDVLASVTDARRVLVERDRQARWFALDASVDIDPGAMWDTTPEIFGIIEDVGARLYMRASDDGTPLEACLAQSWWQGYDETAPGPAAELGLGEDAGLLTAMWFDRVDTAMPLPSPEGHLIASSVVGPGVRVPVPAGWAADPGEDGGSYWVWQDDGRDVADVPSIRITRQRVPDTALPELRDAAPEMVLDAFAAADARSALAGWGREPETVERALVGSARTERPATLLTFRPDFDDSGPHHAIDVVLYVEPWSYLFQHLTPLGDELADRYRFERWLQGVMFLPEDGATGPDG
jgi:hypothetical protein